MRGRVAKDLRRAASELYRSTPGQLPPGWAELQMPRGPNTLRKLNTRRGELIAALIAGGTEVRQAQAMVPVPWPYGMTLVCTGPRSVYRHLKKRYKEGTWK